MSVRSRIGAGCWVACALYLPLHIPVVAAWPQPYSWSRNYVSDLGVTSCQVFTENGQSRRVCSPDFLFWNVGLGLLGFLIMVGSVALWRSGLSRVALALFVISGVCVSVTAAVPWNLAPTVHDVAALGQAMTQLVGMIVLTVQWLRAPRQAGAATVTMIMVGVSGLGTVGLLSMDHFGLGVGIVERLAFDSLTLWSVFAGLWLLLRGIRTTGGATARRSRSR